jgi:hypothetical protein
MGITPIRIREIVLGRLKISLISGAIGSRSKDRLIKSIMAYDLLNPSVLFGHQSSPILLFFFFLIHFKTFLTAEMDRFSIDHRPAGMAHGNIGMTVGIFHQVFTASGKILF